MLKVKQTTTATFSAPALADCMIMLPLINRLESDLSLYEVRKEYDKLSEEEQKEYENPHWACTLIALDENPEVDIQIHNDVLTQLLDLGYESYNFKEYKLEDFKRNNK